MASDRHEHLLTVVRHLPGDFEPFGHRSRKVIGDRIAPRLTLLRYVARFVGVFAHQFFREIAILSAVLLPRIIPTGYYQREFRHLRARLEMSAIEIRPETAQMLAAQANAQGLSVDEYLKTLLGIDVDKRMNETAHASMTVDSLRVAILAALQIADELYLSQREMTDDEIARRCLDALAPDEFVTAMESLAEEDIQPLPRDFSREDIYFPES